MTTDEMLDKLIAAKAKLDAGEELTEQEQADLEEIGEFLSKVIQEFIKVLQEAFEPVIAAIAQALTHLWNSIPDELKEELQKQAEPLKVSWDDVGILHSEVQRPLFVPPYDSEARQSSHYPGRGGW